MTNKVTLITMFLLLFAVVGFGAEKKAGPLKKIAPISGEEEMQRSQGAQNGTIQSSAQAGPGTVLMESLYDFTTNNAVPRTILNYDDGTLAVARMEATMPDVSQDRSSYWTYYDGSAWLLPPTRVEVSRHGWGNISALSDGREVVSAHGGIEVNVDAIKGFGLWISNTTGEWPDDTADLTWPRTTVDGSDVIHMVVTHSTFVPFDSLGQIPAYARSTDEGISWNFRWAFQAPGAAAMDPPDLTNGIWLGGGDADAYAIDAWNNKVAIAALAYYPTTGGFVRNTEIMLWESQDNGQTFTITNVTNIGPDAVQDTAYTPTGELDLVYDNNGDAHVVWGTFLALPDSTGENTDTFSFTEAPLLHWSPNTGVTEVIRRSDIPGLSAIGLPSSSNWGRGLGSGIFWPSIGVDADNHLYVVFNAPNTTFDADTVAYLDVYASASADGGVTWGAPPANITNSAETEDKYPSLAKRVDDNLHLTYQSDGINGGMIQGGPPNNDPAQPLTSPTTVLYLTYPAADVPTEDVVSVDDNIAAVPDGFSLAQNYPNPFNPATQIEFTVPVNGRVSLKIYNLMGQHVDTLVDENMVAGEHSVTWKAPTNLSSGVYVYKLEAEGFTSTRKMVLMK